MNGGPGRDRTGDLVNAIHARSQLRHWPRHSILCAPSATIKESAVRTPGHERKLPVENPGVLRRSIDIEKGAATVHGNLDGVL